MRRLWLSALPISLFLLAAPSHAALNFNFNNPTGDLGTNHAYVTSGVTITAYGFLNSGTTADLFGRNDGANEAGLGMLVDAGSDHEIDISHYIALDLSNITNGSQVTIAFGSLVGQTGEGFNFYEKNGLASAGGISTYGSAIASNQIAGSYTFTKTSSITAIAIQAANADGSHPLANILISTLTATPEPGFYGVLGLGLVTLVLFSRRRGSRARSI
uniref:PEP-CTERM protein-sorting domain-containing protein n=1 Tax=Solibacter usitatus (strain Ellin6076) TaxID=234267 RepID=Q029R5_SOLUE